MTDDLEARVGRIEDQSSARLRTDDMAKLAPARLGGAVMPPDPMVGASPFDVATNIADGAVGATALAGNLFAAPTVALGAAAAIGAATTLIRSDATIAAFDATVPTTSAVGDAAAVGTVAKAARRDHAHARESFATPALVLGTAAAAGVATTPIRSDATLLAFDATVPSAQAFGDAAAVGAATVAARRDHKHAIPVDPVPAHAAAADPHTGYQRETEKGVASGYASLDAGALVPAAQIAAGTPDGTKFLRDDRTWQAAAATAVQVSRDAIAAAADYVARIRLGTDTTYRSFLGLDASDRGTLEFGPGGAAARDVNLYRSAADTLKTDDSLIVGGNLHAGLLMRIGGTAFPASPVAGDVFFRTDLGYQFFWDSTVARWLSTHVETYAFSTQNVLAPAPAAHTYFGPNPQTEAYYLNVLIAIWVVTTNDAANYWTLQGDLYNGAVNTNLGTVNTNGLAPNVWSRREMTQNYLLAGDYEESQIGVTIAVGAPGAIFVNAMGRYRLARAT